MKRKTIKLLSFVFVLMTLVCCRTTKEHIYIDDYYRLTISDSGSVGPSVLDTLFFDNEEVAAIGEYVIALDTHKTKLKVNQWTFYYENGQVEMTGNYKVFSSYDCGFAGVYKYYYCIKSGIWTFYYPNGQLKASGTFDLKIEKVPTNCRGHARVYKSTFNDSWFFYDDNGKEVDFDKSEKYTLKK